METLFITSTGKHYPVQERDRLHFIKHPIENEDETWEAVLVKKGGYDRMGPIAMPFESEEECQKACDMHNKWLGFTEDEVNEIIGWSMGDVKPIEKETKSPDGIELIAAERFNQWQRHGYDVAYDLEHNKPGELAYAAFCIAFGRFTDLPSQWDAPMLNKLNKKPKKERLAIAGALLAAEIDVMNYVTSVEDEENPDYENSGQL